MQALFTPNAIVLDQKGNAGLPSWHQSKEIARSMLVIGPNNVVTSTLYGWDGSKELRSLLKTLRLDRGHLKNEGHPVDEHILLPVAKRVGLLARGVQAVGGSEFQALRAAKSAQQHAPIVVTGVAETTADVVRFEPPPKRDWKSMRHIVIRQADGTPAPM
jgi:hypothetical protein